MIDGSLTYFSALSARYKPPQRFIVQLARLNGHFHVEDYLTRFIFISSSFQFGLYQTLTTNGFMRRQEWILFRAPCRSSLVNTKDGITAFRVNLRIGVTRWQEVVHS